jgi:AraC-like DNA-binding protein
VLLGVRDAALSGLRVESAPARPLTGAVLGYRGYHEVASTPRDRWETPAGEVILVLGLGDPFLAQEQPGVGRPTRFTSFVVGLHERPIHTIYQNRQSGVQVRLDPLAAATLLGVPMHELANRVVDLAEVVGTGERWAPVLASAQTWPQRFAALDLLLTQRFGTGRPPSSTVQRAWAALRQSAGALRIEDLVSELGCSHRHLVGLFRREVGLTPKRAARVLRYERAARRLRDRAATPATVAVECGYTDQPHLTREFHRYAGITPAVARGGDPWLPEPGQFSPRR